MKFNKLFAAPLALALSASDVSAKYQNQLRGIASSVLLEDSSWSADSNSRGDSNSQDSFGHRISPRNWEPADSSADSNSTSADSVAIADSNSSDEPDYYYEDFFTNNNFFEKDSKARTNGDTKSHSQKKTEPEFSSMYIAAGNRNSNRGRCIGRGWNTCDNRRAECRWEGDRNTGHCVDRDNNNNNNNNKDSSSSSNNNNSNFNRGLNQGRSTAQDLWRRMGNSCSNAWSNFSDRINQEINNRSWNSTRGSWTTRAFNEGARAGMQQVLRERERQCFNSATECIDLGNEAARMIAFRHCNPNLASRAGSNNYRATCRDVAIGQCQGQIFTQVRNECGRPSTRTTSQLQNQCRGQVNSMIR
jgi:hypothetical protein